MEIRATPLKEGRPAGKSKTRISDVMGTVYVLLVYQPGSRTQVRWRRESLHPWSGIRRGRSIGDVLRMTVDEAWRFFDDEPALHRSLSVVREVGLGYLRLGQPATELSGGEAQRIKLATELQRMNKGDALYVLDEPTTGLHATDVERLMTQLHGLVDAGNTVVVVEHDMGVVAESDWVIDMGPGAGEDGGRIVAEGPPSAIARSESSRTAPYLARVLQRAAAAE